MNTVFHSLRYLLLTTALAGTGVAISAWWIVTHPAPTLIEAIQQRGSLRVAILNSPISYQATDEGRIGFEYELAQRFAEFLGVSLELRVVSTRKEALSLLNKARVELVAAGLINEPNARPRVRFGPTYLTVSEVLVGTPKKFRRDAQDIRYALKDPASAQTLQQLLDSDEALRWRVLDQPTEATMRELNQGKLQERTLLFGYEFDRLRSYYPEVVEHRRTPPVRELAWAVRQSQDSSLAQALEGFFDLEQDTLETLIQSHFNAFSEFDYAALQLYLKRIRTRLPKYKKFFLQAEKDTGLDWRLIAAVAHQESHWRAKATSPTGVRGLMMLTRPTAKEQKVSNRLDPEQSTLGGARHLKKMLGRLPEDIEARDRMAFALAAYNVGLGHLYDARSITREQGANPGVWSEVRLRLPLLEQKQWYQKAKYGRARGREPVKYVANVLQYYDILVWLDQRKTQRQPETLAAPPRTNTPWLFDSLAPPKL